MGRSKKTHSDQKEIEDSVLVETWNQRNEKTSSHQESNWRSSDMTCLNVAINKQVDVYMQPNWSGSNTLRSLMSTVTKEGGSCSLHTQPPREEAWHQLFLLDTASTTSEIIPPRCTHWQSVRPWLVPNMVTTTTLTVHKRRFHPQQD